MNGMEIYMMMIYVCVGQKKQRSMCFFSVNAMTWRGEDGRGHWMCLKRRKEQWT